MHRYRVFQVSAALLLFGSSAALASLTARAVSAGAPLNTVAQKDNLLSQVTSNNPSAAASYVVSTVGDDPTGTPANCNGTGSSNCSLRDALAAASAAGGAVITFDGTVFGGGATITLGSGGSLVLPSNTAVNGLTSGSGYTLTNLVTVSGASLYDIFVVNPGTTSAALANLTLTNGSLAVPAGASAVVNNGGALVLSNSTITFDGGAKGAVFNGAGGSLTVSGSTFFDNGSYASPGGAINNQGTLTLTNSTITQNAGQGGGSGVLSSGALTVVNSTIFGNVLPDVTSTGTAKFTNTILGTCSGASCPANTNGNFSVVYFQAGFGNYGGPTQTVPLYPGQTGTCQGIPTTLKTDQRGLPRSTVYGNQTCYDAGAVQGNYSLAFSTQPPASIPAGNSFTIGLQLEESGASYGQASLSLALGAGDSGTLNQTSLDINNGAATASGISVGAPGNGDTIVAALSLSAPGAPDPVSLTTVSRPFDVTPNSVAVTVESGTDYGGEATPAFSVDGVSYTQPVTFTWAVGSQHALGAPSPQHADGCKEQIFQSWSDRGAISHTVSAVTTTTFFGVTFGDYPTTPSVCTLTTIAKPSAGGTVTPATASYPLGTYVSLTATPKSGYTFVSWTGSVASPTSASTYLYVGGMQTVTANFYALTTQTSYVVNTAADDAIGNPASCASSAGTCTLRDALVGALEAGKGSITFSPTVFAASQPVAARTISLNAVLVIPSNTTITGPTTGSGPTLTQLVTVTPLNDTAFEVDKGTSNVSISGLSISGANLGYGVTDASAVRTDGELSISNSAITGNVIGRNVLVSGSPAVSNGVDGKLTLTNCNVSGNYDSADPNGGGPGGGIYNQGTMVVNGSTISGNAAEQSNGGGILNTGTATLTDTSVSGNQIIFYNDGGKGGGIYNYGKLSLVHSSVTGNSASNPGDGSGIYNVGTLHITNSPITSNLTNYNQSYDYLFFPAVEDDCDGPGCPAQPIPAPPVFTPPSGTYANYGSVAVSDTSSGTVFFYTTDGSTPTTSSNLIDGEPIYIGGSGVTTVKVIAFANGESSAVATATYTSATAACTLIDYHAGFTPADLTLNGGASINGSLLQLTDGGFNEARSAFYSTPVPTTEFTTDFQFQLSNPIADGITFTIQSTGPHALGEFGGGLGYAGIPKSVALKFDLFSNNGEGFDSTGYYLNGAYPSTPAINLSPYGIQLHSGHIFAVHIAYAGQVTTVTITDVMTYQSYSASVPGDLTRLVGTSAYVGFTGGTGLLSATQNILTWTYGGGSSCGTSSAP